MEQWKKPGGLRMGTSIFCLACKNQLWKCEREREKRRVGVHRHTELFLKESEGSKPFLGLPRLWLNRAFPNAPRRCSRLSTSGGCNYRRKTLKKVLPLKKYFWYFSQKICESFYTRVEWQMINYHTYLSPQGCSQSLEKKKKHLSTEEIQIPEKVVTINISRWNKAFLGKMFKSKKQRENPQSIKPKTLLHSRTHPQQDVPSLSLVLCLLCL